eukprot:GEMP01006740.1.p1 GENE.GEMP01006740.1~~GEMP01006740.1.p1  ORF type:complete len:285 (+),score=55.16 GEMP01006740.1:776-1630(+)
MRRPIRMMNSKRLNKNDIINSLCARQESVGNLSASLVSGAGVTAVDMKGDFTCHERNECRINLSLPRDSLSGAEYDGTFEKSDQADGDSEYILNGLQSFNRITMVSAKPNSASGVDESECTPRSNIHNRIPYKMLESDILVERGSRSQRTYQTHKSSSCCIAEEVSERDCATLALYERPLADESDHASQRPGDKGTLQLLMQSENGAATAVRGSSLPSRVDDPKANPQKSSVAKFGALPPNCISSWRRHTNGTQQMRRVPSGGHDMASTASSQQKKGVAAGIAR